MNKMENIGDIFTEEGRKKLRKKQLLVFLQGGVKITYKIISLPGNGNVWVRRINTVDGEALNAHDGHELDTRTETVEKYHAPLCQTCNLIIGPEITPEQFEASN